MPAPKPEHYARLLRTLSMKPQVTKYVAGQTAGIQEDCLLTVTDSVEQVSRHVGDVVRPMP